MDELLTKIAADLTATGDYDNVSYDDDGVLLVMKGDVWLTLAATQQEPTE